MRRIVSKQAPVLVNVLVVVMTGRYFLIEFRIFPPTDVPLFVRPNKLSHQIYLCLMSQLRGREANASRHNEIAIEDPIKPISVPFVCDVLEVSMGPINGSQ